METTMISARNAKRLLDSIDSPKDLKLLKKDQLPQLAKEIRERILEVVSKNGGHLGGPLGAVELSIALHYVFDAPQDKIIFDTGHQSYPHKLLTGRNKSFDTLRQHKGVCGFCNIEESEYDVFGAGHASTSISAALGIAKARDLKGEKNKVIAVIGDGAMTAGMAYEALNNAGSLQSDLLIILNDNRMSISPNVGALSKYLHNIVTLPQYASIRKNTATLLKAIPGVTDSEVKMLWDIEGKVRGIGTPASLFEELGFKYFGPIDGHNTHDLINALTNLKDMKGPVILHILTEKGKGYPFAHTDIEKLHGMSPFNVTNGKKHPTQGAITYTAAFADALITIAKSNEKIVGITAAMKSGTGLDKFEKAFPDRFFDVGIAEQHAATFAAGLAINGMRPVCAIYSTFLQRSFDQIIHDIAIQDLPVIFALDRAGLVGDDGPTHNGPFDIAYLRLIPNMTVMVPKDENELGNMLYTAASIEGPSSIRFPRGSGVGVPRSDALIRLPVAKAEIMQKGKDILIIGVGPILYEAIEAAKEANIHPTIINARFVKPLDESMIIAEAKKHDHIITLEEGTRAGGFGSAVSELLASTDARIP
ncbi:MAG TPA: 1-deoxy-D-xylulose-5-phosphate synthase, partial [Candidatus Nanoarchaeia archaeon]|nr:1-deoxy-D-xylulose-5-phosphate synthase [Candidatus Nanoarchaeia archaeon]